MTTPDALAPDAGPPDAGPVGARYRSSRLRTEALLRDLDETAWERLVPACPGWRVRDVLAHLVGVIEDAAAGRISGPPSPQQTAVEVDRHRADDPVELLGRWGEMAPLFEDALSERGMWPGFFDALSHEHDIRGALDRPGERGHDDVRLASRLLTAHIDAPVALELHVGDDVIHPAGADGPPLRLRASAFELVRLRLGRRSRAQVVALDWSGDPASVVDRLFIFGPAADDVRE